MRSGTRSLIVASLLAAAAVGCDHRPEDFRRVQASTDAFQSSWARRIGEVEARHGELFARAQKVPADTAGIAEVLSGLAAVDTQLDALGGKAAGVTEQATAKVQEKHRRLAEEALQHGERDLSAELAALTAQLDEIGAQLDAAEAAAGAASAAANPPPPPPQLDDPAFARGTYAADVSGVEFQRDTAQLDLVKPTSKAALDRIVAFAQTCDGLRFGITGHTAKDGDARKNQLLSEARAHAVRKHLIGAGVVADKIVRVEGVGGTRPLLAEPEPGTPEEAAMQTGELARIREVNRRIGIQVVTPCM